MCGFAGCWSRDPKLSEDGLAATGAAMVRTLAHRGPDGWGEWTDAEAGFTLAHRRLAINDLSPSGAQPMLSADGRYVVALNGEIYNFRALREQLEGKGHGFRGTSDT